MDDPATLWRFLGVGYALTVLVEAPILLVGLSERHSLGRRFCAGLWLTACTYPIVVLVLPLLLEPRSVYLIVAETFAPAAECLLFWATFGMREHLGRASMWRDLAAIVAANLASFIVGEVWYEMGSLT